jgi:hypothetical protein
VFIQKGTSFPEVFHHEWGVHAITDENGWLSVVDEEGFTLGMYPKENVVRVLLEQQVKAGETNVT